MDPMDLLLLKPQQPESSLLSPHCVTCLSTLYCLIILLPTSKLRERVKPNKHKAYHPQPQWLTSRAQGAKVHQQTINQLHI